MRKVTVPTVITNGHFDREKTLAEVKRCGADRIAIAIDRELDYTFSSPENLRLIKELIEYYEANGVETLVWLGETCGHAGGKADENPHYTHVRTLDKGDTQPFCVMDERFISAFCNWVQNVAKCGAKMIMLDDDMRYTYRGDGFGCCCTHHMEALRAELSEDIREDEIMDKVYSGGKSPYRDAWLKVQGDGIRNFARRLREALDEVNPEVRLSFCCPPVAWDQEGYDALEIAEIMAGKTKPFLRTTGAPYWVNEWNDDYFGEKTLGEVIEVERMQIDWCRGHDIELMTEGDTYPRPRFTTPASHLECFDMALCAAEDNADILKYMLDYVADADFETGYVDAMTDNKDNYEWIEKHFRGKECVGVTPYNKMRKFENTPIDINDYASIRNADNSLFAPSSYFTSINTLPTAYGGDGARIVFGENGRYIEKDELSSGAILDITAAKYLMDRGIDVGIKNIGGNISFVQKGLTDTVNYYFPEEDIYTRIHRPVKLIEAVIKPTCKTLIEFARGEHFPACFAYENAEGMRFMVFLFDAMCESSNMGVFENYALRRVINKYLEWLGRKPLPVLFDTNAPEAYMVVKRDEKTVTVGFWNMYADKIKNAAFKIGVDYKDVEFYNCQGHSENGKIVFDTTVYPYEFAAFELEL